MFALVFSMSNAFGQVKVVTSGDVGIGADTPAEKLHVAGNVRVEGVDGSQNIFCGVPSRGTLWLF